MGLLVGVRCMEGVVPVERGVCLPWNPGGRVCLTNWRLGGSVLSIAMEMGDVWGRG